MKNPYKLIIHIIGLVILFSTTFTNANHYYGSVAIGNIMTSDKTYDCNESIYPYNFSTNIMSFKSGIGKHINNRFDLGFELMTTSKLYHKYSGPVESQYDYIKGINLIPNNSTVYAFSKYQIYNNTFRGEI